MKQTYECMVLLDNREVKKGWAALKERVLGMFKKHGADPKSARRWEERRLAYPIGRQKRGTYLLVYFEGEKLQTAAIRRELELTEWIMRHMILTAETIPASAYDAEAAFDESTLPVDDESDRAPSGMSAASGQAGARVLETAGVGAGGSEATASRGAGSERGSERSERGAERGSERGADRGAERGGERGAGRGPERGSERGAERGTDKAAADKAAADKAAADKAAADKAAADKAAADKAAADKGVEKP